MHSEIDLIEEFFGEQLSPDLIQRVAEADYRALHSFREAERQFEDAFILPSQAS